MAEEIVIGKLVIDTGDLEASMASGRRAVIDLENEQRKLKKETDNLSNANDEQLKTFIANENELKRLKTEYAANQKSVLELTKAQLGLDAALSENIKLESQAIANNKELIAARRAIDATTVEGAKAIENINAKIDANNKFINDGSSALEKQKANVGNYPEIMNNVGNAFGGATQQVIGFVQQGQEVIKSAGALGSQITASASSVIGFGNASKKAAEANKLLQISNGGVEASTDAVAKGSAAGSSGIMGMVKASLAFIATPIGAVIAAIALVLGILVTVFKSFQPVVDKVEQAMAALSAVFNVVKNTILALVTGTKSLGEAFSGLGGDMADAAKSAAALKKAQQDLDDVMEQQVVGVAKSQAEIKKLEVQLKNRTLSEQERIKISEQITSKTEELFKRRQATVLEELRIAKESLRIKAGLSRDEVSILDKGGKEIKEILEERVGNVDAEVEALNKARLKAIDLENEKTTDLETQMNKRDKLEDEAQAKREARAAKAQAARDKAFQQELKDAQNRIDILKLEADADNLTTEQKIANLQKINELQNALAKKGLEGTDEQKKLLENAQELSNGLLALADEQITKESENQKKRFEQVKAVNVEIYDEQTQNANLLAEAQIKLLNKNLLSERAYTEEVNKIYIARNEALAITQANFDAAEKVRQETELANLKALEEVNFQIKLQDILDRDATEAEIKQALRDAEYAKELQDLDKSLADQQVSREVYDAKRAFAEKKYRSDTAKNDKALADQKKAQNLNMLNDGLNALGQLFEGSKAIAVAQALVNTYQGITAGLKLGYPAAIPAVAFAAISGFAAVRNILKTNKNSSGDSGSTASAPTTSGTGSFVNSAQTETVAKVSEPPSQQNTVVTPPVLVVESVMEVMDNIKVKQESN